MKKILLLILVLLTTLSVNAEVLSRAQRNTRAMHSIGGFAGHSGYVYTEPKEDPYTYLVVPQQPTRDRVFIAAALRNYTKQLNGVATIGGYVTGKTTNTVTLRYAFNATNPKYIYTQIKNLSDTSKIEIGSRLIIPVTQPRLVSLTNDSWAIIEAKVQ